MNRWATTVVTRRWWVLGLAILIVAVAGAWGTGVFGNLSSAGFYDPNSESYRVAEIVEENFGPQTADIVAMYTAPPEGRTVADIEADVTAVLDRFAAEVPTHAINTYWSTAPPPANQLLLSKDGRSVAASITLSPPTRVSPSARSIHCCRSSRFPASSRSSRGGTRWWPLPSRRRSSTTCCAPRPSRSPLRSCCW